MEKEVNNPRKEQWEPMRLTYVAHVSEIVLGGGGKVSATTGDPGEPFRCPPGQTCDF